MKSQASHGEFFFALSGTQQLIQAYTAWSPKGPSLSSLENFAASWLSSFTQKSVVAVGRAGHVAEAPSVCFCKTGSGNTAEVFPHSALLGSSQTTGGKPRTWGDDAVVGGGTALAAAEDAVTYWKRR